MTVLRMATNTNIVKTLGGITPRSYPTLMTTSSINARVFIMIPRQFESAQLNPQKRAANEQPMNLPMVAAPIIAAHQPHNAGESKPWTLVRSPVKVKKIGRKNTVTKWETVFFQAATNG